MALTQITHAQIKGASVTPDSYGATGTGDDTVAVQAALDSGLPVVFTRSYYVTSVTYNADYGRLDFNGHALIGIAAVATDCILLLKPMHSTIYNVLVTATTTIGQLGNGAYNNDNYATAIRWYNSTGATQFNDIFGLTIRYVRYGFTYGLNSGGTPAGSSHSENAIFGFRTRGVQNPCTLNATAAVLSFHDAIFVNNNEEWSGAPVAFNWFNSRAIVCESCITSVFGGELQTAAQDPATPAPYCANLLNIRWFGTRVETAPTILIAGDNVHFIGCEMQNLQGNSVDMFVVNSGVTGATYFENCNIYRTGTVIGANVRFFNNSAATLVECVLSNSTLFDIPIWPLVSFPSQQAVYNNLKYKALSADTTVFRLNSDNENLLEIKGVDCLGYNTATGWYTTTSGGGTHTFTVDTTITPPYGNLASSFKLLADALGGSVTCNTVDVTSGASVISTGIKVKPGLNFRVAITSLMTTYVTTNSVLHATFWNTAGASVSSLSVIPYAQFAQGLSAWFASDAVFTVPAGAAYMGIDVSCAYSGGTAQLNFSNLVLQKA